MGLVTMKSILDDASTGGYAVPAFDAVDHASVEAIITAAEKTGKPVIIMVPEVAIPLIDVESFFDFLVYRINKSDAKIALELDHGRNLDLIALAINSGFTGVMYDGSELPIEENIANTKKVVELAKAKDVSVEAEIGHVGGGEGNVQEASDVDEMAFTRPEDAKYFAEATGVDALAVAIGTVHGLYKGTPKLDFGRLGTINELIDIPLVLHGGSGVSPEEFVKAIANGINKINLFTEISMSAVSQAVDYANAKEKKLHFAEMILVGRKTVEQLAENYLKLFNPDK